MRLDARIPVLILTGAADDLPPADPLTLLLLATIELPAPLASSWAAVRSMTPVWIDPALTHPAGCACCTRPIGGLALTLSELFAERARARLAWFNRVLLLVPPTQLHPVFDLLRNDPLLAGRYRREEGAGEN